MGTDAITVDGTRGTYKECVGVRAGQQELVLYMCYTSYCHPLINDFRVAENNYCASFSYFDPKLQQNADPHAGSKHTLVE
jgi:hypothetical protein